MLESTAAGMQCHVAAGSTGNNTTAAWVAQRRPKGKKAPASTCMETVKCNVMLLAVEDPRAWTIRRRLPLAQMKACCPPTTDVFRWHLECQAPGTNRQRPTGREPKNMTSAQPESSCKDEDGRALDPSEARVSAPEPTVTRRVFKAPSTAPSQASRAIGVRSEQAKQAWRKRLHSPPANASCEARCKESRERRRKQANPFLDRNPQELLACVLPSPCRSGRSVIKSPVLSAQ